MRAPSSQGRAGRDHRPESSCAPLPPWSHRNHIKSSEPPLPLGSVNALVIRMDNGEERVVQDDPGGATPLLPPTTTCDTSPVGNVAPSQPAPRPQHFPLDRIGDAARSEGTMTPDTRDGMIVVLPSLWYLYRDGGGVMEVQVRVSSRSREQRGLSPVHFSNCGVGTAPA